MAWLQADKNDDGQKVAAANLSREQTLHEVKNRLHRSLVKRLNVTQLEGMESSVVAAEIRRAVAQLLAEDPFPLNSEERARVTQDL